MNKTPLAALVLAVALVASPVSAQTNRPIQWEPDRPLVSRESLMEQLRQMEAVATSDEFSNDIREQYRGFAQQIRDRLENGDFKQGDKIQNFSVRPLPPGESVPPEITIEAGPSIEVSVFGAIDLKGVLRSELEEHLERELSVYLKEPRVTAEPTIRLLIRGTGSSGFFDYPGNLLITDVLMASGGFGQAADLEDISVTRGDFELYDGDEMEQALMSARSLDQLNLQSGDQIVVPQDQPSQVRGQIIRWGLIIGSSALLGRRIFF